jgi:mRNA interferase RelE/StbE
MKMKPYKLRVPDDTATLIRNLHPQIKKKVKASLKMIISDPASGKPLKDELSGLKSFRVSKFRIIYRIAGKRCIEIVTIGPRRRIYEETLRLLKKEGK